MLLPLEVQQIVREEALEVSETEEARVVHVRRGHQRNHLSVGKLQVL